MLLQLDLAELEPQAVKESSSGEASLPLELAPEEDRERRPA